METLHNALKLPFKLFLEYSQQNEFLYIIVALIATFGILGQWVLYYKCDLPGHASVVPLWNVVVFLKIYGPCQQSYRIIPKIIIVITVLMKAIILKTFSKACSNLLIIFIIPPPIIFYVVYTGDTSIAANIALISMLSVFMIFTITLYIEICKCFGKRSFIDYILVLVFNGLYVMYLGMSSDTEYLGPLYGKNKQSIKPKA